MSSEQTRKLIVLAAIWAALIFAPYWMVPLGGYTALATRVLELSPAGPHLYGGRYDEYVAATGREAPGMRAMVAA